MTKHHNGPSNTDEAGRTTREQLSSEDHKPLSQQSTLVGTPVDPDAMAEGAHGQPSQSDWPHDRQPTFELMVDTSQHEANDLGQTDIHGRSERDPELPPFDREHTSQSSSSQSSSSAEDMQPLKPFTPETDTLDQQREPVMQEDWSQFRQRPHAFDAPETPLFDDNNDRDLSDVGSPQHVSEQYPSRQDRPDPSLDSETRPLKRRRLLSPSPSPSPSPEAPHDDPPKQDRWDRSQRLRGPRGR